MSTTELAYHRKYRPTTVKGYIGNDRLKKTAFATLAKDKRPQVILLSGASGCGKTTFARLLAKEYLCEDRDVVNGACGLCASCEELEDYIQTGDSSLLANVKEVDIADQNGKRDIDVVLEDMLSPAIDNQWRVFIFDEVHMATHQAQNRMLKIAEEPPENVLIILCTTDPDMLLETLRNRCQLTLRVKKPTVSELGGLLRSVCSAEGVDSDIKGTNFIANRSDLTIRKALVSLEQVVNEKGDAKYTSAIAVFDKIADTIIVEFYKKLLGTPEYDTSGNVLKDSNNNPVMKRDVLGFVNLIHKIRTQTELKSFVEELADFTKRGIYVINQVTLDGVSDGDVATYKTLFSSYSVEQIACLLNEVLILTDNVKDIELKLLTLGYKGITVSHADTTEQGTLDTGIASILNEISLETKQGNNEREAVSKQIESNGILAADDSVKPATLSDIESLFGATEVNI